MAGSKLYSGKRDANLKRFFNITLKKYDEILESQGGGCAICHEPPGDRALSVDHSHETGHIRGLLCSECNRGLGTFKDDKYRLMGAILYLARPNPATYGLYVPDKHKITCRRVKSKGGRRPLAAPRSDATPKQVPKVGVKKGTPRRVPWQ